MMVIIFFACNCPNTPSIVRHNSYYGYLAGFDFGPFVSYDHSNCTDFGGNARDSSGHLPPFANNATDCCNFCCGRNDLYPKTTTTNGRD